MNIERLETIAEWLEAGAPHTDGHGFNMSTWYNHCIFDYSLNLCGTVMCIGGAAEYFFGSPSYNKSTVDSHKDAALILGLDHETAEELFYPYELEQDEDEFEDWNDITPKHAAKVIRNLISTGKVDWNVK